MALGSLLLVLGIANSGCGGRLASDANGTGVGGGDSFAAACTNADAENFAELTAPSGDSFAEAALAVGDSEVGLAYTQWHDETHDVTVYLQRYGLDGTPLGAPASLHTYNEESALYAVGEFYGRPTIATDGTHFVACWGEGNQLGCGAVEPATAQPSFHAIVPDHVSPLYAPHLVFGPAGFRVFFQGTSLGGTSVALDAEANPSASGIDVAGSTATAIGFGFAVVSVYGGTVFFLGPDLGQVGVALQTPETVYGITSLDGDAIVVGGRTLRRVTVEGHFTTVDVTGDGHSHVLAVAARKGNAGVVWSAPGSALRFKEIAAGAVPGAEKNVGCAALLTNPTIAAVPDGYLIAAARPEGEHEVFHARGYSKLRITHVAVP